MRSLSPYRLLLRLSTTLLPALLLSCMTGCMTGAPAPGIEELPKSRHWNAPELLALTRDAKAHRSDALIIVQSGQLLYRAGETVEKINTHSVRKSIMAVLYGVAVEKGLINLDDSLKTLGYDDRAAPLTATEQQATIADLLKSRSGIYIDASGQNWQRPPRHSAAPGASFFYNNWGFNALGEILERKAGMPLGDILVEWLAKPLGMQHFSARDVDWDSIDGSSVRQYIIYMSADDLTRFALLVAGEGMYQGKRLVSEHWVRDMTTPHSSIRTDAKHLFGGGFFEGYGYLWWTRFQNGRRLICADGWGGQYIIIDPQTQLVMINRRNTGTHLLAQGWFLWLGKETDRPYIYQLFENVHALLESKEDRAAPAPKM